MNHDQAHGTDDLQQKILELEKALNELQLQNEGLKHARDELQTALQRFATFYDFAPIGFITLNEQGCILEANLTATAMLGLQPRQLLGQKLLNFITNEDLDCYFLHCRQLFEQLEHQSCDLHFKRADGSEIFVHLEANAIVENNTSQKTCYVSMTDISELKLVLEALTQSGEKYRNIFDHALEGIFQSTPSGRYISVNNAMASIFGYTSPEEMIASVGNDIEHRVHVNPERRAEFIRILEHHGVVLDFEAPNFRKDGSVIWTRTNARAVRDADGMIMWYEGFVEDITRHKQMETDLQKSEEQLRSIVNNAKDFILIKDTASRYVMINPAWYRYYQMTPAEAIGKTDREIFGDRLTQQFEEIDRRVLAGEILELEVSAPLAGSLHTLHSVNVPLRNASGEITGLCSIVRDISEIKQVEEALRRERDFANQLMETCPVGIMVFDPEGNITYTNPRAQQTYGEPQEILLQRTNGDPSWQLVWLDGKPMQPDETPFSRVMNTRRPVYDERFLSSHKDRRILLSESAAPVFNRQGEIEAVICILEDITEKHRLQETLTSAQRLASLGTFAAGIAHEMNSPLQVITGLCDSLLRRSRQGNLPNQDLIHDLEIAKRNTWRVVEVVRALASFTQATGLRTGEYNLNEIVHDTLVMVRGSLEDEANIQVVTQLSPDLPTLRCDPNQVTQILLNLIANAREAMLEGGKLIFRSAYQAQQKYLILQVEDTGTGIAEEIRGAIFDPFFTTKSAGDGMGLGLPVVLNIMRSYGGDVLVDSIPGRGTNITLRFPEHPVEASMAESASTLKGRYGQGEEDKHF